MYTFYVTVHALPADCSPGPVIELGGRTLHTLNIARETLSKTPMSTSFEETRERLSSLVRMYCEPDGSFVWVSSQGEPSWQVDGNLYDLAERLLFIDLKGTCPGEALDQLLTAFGWPAMRVMFQLTREAVFLDEAEFRHHAVERGQVTGYRGQ